MQGYNANKFHSVDISGFTFLITGGAGFIGSNLVDYLLHYGAGEVRVLDNLSNGSMENLKDHENHPNFEFIEGDIRDSATCLKAVKGVDYVSHQAALGSVPRSIKDPITSNDVNISGFLNMLEASRQSESLKRFIYAASSSTYGDSKELPKQEGKEGNPLSPYAVTKLVNELYADVYSKVYGFHTIGLRYFNVFGPKQSFDNPYAAVIPIFCNCFIKNEQPIINGDGETSRDFTYVENAVQANVKALLHNDLNKHEVFNVACGEQTSLLEIIDILGRVTGKNMVVKHGPERPGDVKHSLANISKLKDVLGYEPTIYFEEGLKKVYEWYMNN
jgi:UDP-N-acetylglucosamine 4-epimerase